MDRLLQESGEKLEQLWAQTLEIWSNGGWAMYGIAIVAFAMFSIGVHIHLALRRKARVAVSEQTWRRWIDHPRERSGALGDLLDRVTGGNTLGDTVQQFEQLRKTETAPFERDLRVMKVCVSAAPLVGLLGTVTGMLATFEALATGSGGEKTMGMIASGISEALITTETGLVVALPGLFFQYQLTRRFQAYKMFLAHLETVCCQAFHRRENDERRRAARRVAAAKVLETMRARLGARATAAPTRTIGVRVQGGAHAR